MNVIFLDFDGVLNNMGQMIRDDRAFISDAANLDKTSVGILRFVCKCTGARLVISSSWRILNYDPVWYQGVFNTYGWYDVEIAGITPDKHGHRGTEIAEWIGNHHNVVDAYVIIDDDSDMLPEQPFVHIDGLVGLTLYNAIDMIEILGVLPDQKDRYNSIKEHVDFKRNKEKNNEKLKQVHEPSVETQTRKYRDIVRSERLDDS